MDQAVGEHYQDLVLFYESPNSRIYKAWDTESQFYVILKCFPPERQAAFLREMSAAFGIDHPNINHCLDTLYFQAQDRSCMVYEYLAGGSLRGYLQEHGALPSADVFCCLKDMLKALEHVHSKGFIHCDLKPENILLREGDAGIIDYVLSDLGAAASIREAHTGTHTMSSPAYAAPERLYDRFTPSSDLYSLGVIGYELATGQRPFSGDTAQIARAHLNDTPDFARISHPYLREFIARLMDKEPLQRSTAQQALRNLQQFEGGANIALNVEDSAPVKHPIRMPEPSQRGICLQNQRPCCEQYLDYRLDKLLIFNLNKQPIVGLGYDNNLSLVSERAPQPLYLLANANPVKTQSAHSLLYASRGAVYCLDLALEKHLCVHEASADLTAFDARGSHILWSTAESGHLYNRDSDGQLSFRNPNYLMRPVLYLFDEGRFASSEGYMNQQLVIRNAKTEKELAWELDGPIVQCQEMAGSLMILTMGMEHHSCYSLWRLGIGSKPQKYELPETLMQYCFTTSQVFWVTAIGEFYACGPQLKPRLVGQLPLERIDLMVISLDHQFIAVANHQGSQSRVQVWENPDGEVICP